MSSSTSRQILSSEQSIKLKRDTCVDSSPTHEIGYGAPSISGRTHLAGTDTGGKHDIQKLQAPHHAVGLDHRVLRVECHEVLGLLHGRALRVSHYPIRTHLVS